MRAWLHGYPALVDPYRDSDGLPPRHSFFFPGEEYQPAYLDALASLARRGLGEVELHLHHHDDTPDGLRAKIAEYLRLFDGHGHLTRTVDGKLRYAFIHGNWCLANARPDGRWCGVDAELPLLFDTGCYADFTFPAAPDPSQPPIVNQIYWPDGDLARRRAQDAGVPARVGDVRRDRILMIEGPLALHAAAGPLAGAANRERRGDGRRPADARRGCAAGSARASTSRGAPSGCSSRCTRTARPRSRRRRCWATAGQMLHTELTTRYNDGKRWRLHYVTAREMFNIAIAAMDGKDGDPGAFRDHVLPPPPAAAA